MTAWPWLDRAVTAKQRRYECALLDTLTVLRTGACSAAEVRAALGSECGAPPSMATVYARLAVLEERGVASSRKRRAKVMGKSGHRERVYVAVRR